MAPGTWEQVQEPALSSSRQVPSSSLGIMVEGVGTDNFWKLGSHPQSFCICGSALWPEHQGILNFLHDSANQNIRGPGDRTCGLEQAFSTFEPQNSSLHSKQLGLRNPQFTCLPLRLLHGLKATILQFVTLALTAGEGNTQHGKRAHLSGSRASGTPFLTLQARDHLTASQRVARSILGSGDAVTGLGGDVLMQSVSLKDLPARSQVVCFV